MNSVIDKNIPFQTFLGWRVENKKIILNENIENDVFFFLFVARYENSPLIRNR